MALIGIGQPRFEQPQEFTRLSDRFAVPEAFVYVPGIGTVYGGDRPTFSSSAITRTPAQGMSAVQTATNSVGITTNKLRRVSPGAATFVFVGARRASTAGFLSGVLDTGTSYIDQVGINMNSSEVTSAGNVMLGYRDTAGVIRQRATTSAPLVLNKMHGVFLRIDDDLSYRCWVDGVEHSMTGGTNSPGASAGFMQYDYALLNRSNRGSLGAVSITNFDLALFARFASNFISDPAGLSRNPWQLFEDRRIWVPQAAASGLPTLGTVSATAITSSGFRPNVTYTY